MHNLRTACILALLFLFCCSRPAAQSIPYINSNNGWDADSLGNQRAVIQMKGDEKLARVRIDWRRSDNQPEKKRWLLLDASTMKCILNVYAAAISKEFVDLYFEPVSGKKTYYLYYMPYKKEGNSNYPLGIYLKPVQTASSDWLRTIQHSTISPNAECIAIESINGFNSPYPMEVIANADEVYRLQKRFERQPFLVFAEKREYSIRMDDELPQRWIHKEPFDQVIDSARKGENFSFQLGIYAMQHLQNLQIEFSDLVSNQHETIPKNRISCINTSGVSYDGHSFTKKLEIQPHKVQALWCYIRIPEKAPTNVYRGTARISINGQYSKTIKIEIHVLRAAAVNAGVNEPWKMTRLPWLNSTLAQKNEVISPYTPLKVKGSSIYLLGRKIDLSEDGFPAQIQTFFTEEMTGLSSKPLNELAEPVHFVFSDSDGKAIQAWQSSGITFSKKEKGTVEWTSLSKNKDIRMEVFATLEFDGFITYRVKITPMRDLHLQDISLMLPFRKEVARYMMGLGQKGGLLPANFSWKWDVANKNQDGAWVGTVNAGIQYSLRDESYSRPLNTNFYLEKPLLLPSSWGNENKGGIRVLQNDTETVFANYSGSRTLKKGSALFFNFNLLITPFHTINTDFQWSTRFYHRYNRPDSIKATGATVVNIHHGTAINPWINYPFIEWRKMKSYIDSAHALGLKVKIYNTIRELSDHAYETFALRSLGHEVFSPGQGGGFSWLQEHLRKDYIAAWFVPEIKDAAIVNSGMNRWHNYYVEGMNWLVNNVGIDGIYLDDVAFDRITMKRIKRVLIQNNHPGIIDLHSANQYDKADGFNNSAMLYMEHFPFLNRLWFGEGFDYENNSPAYFLTEISGIPFGLMGEMLEGGGNPWRGMIYGMTNRLPWSENADPRPLWKLWDSIGMQGMEMIGYWSSRCPVRTSNDSVLVTVYKKPGIVLLSVASWAAAKTNVRLQINWKALGIDSANAIITAPAISGIQEENVFSRDDLIEVEKNKGKLLLIKAAL